MNEERNIGIITGTIYVMNTSIGEGILSFPWAYQHAGLVLALIVQVIVALIVYTIALQLLGVLSRCEVIAALRDREKKTENDETGLIASAEQNPTPQITKRRFDYLQIVRLILGDTAYGTAFVFLSFFTILLCASYVMVFAASFSAAVPITGLGTCNVYDEDSDRCTSIYMTWGIIFIVFMTTLTMYGYREQAWFQIIMFCVRMCFLFIFYIASLHLLIVGKEVDSDDDRGEVVDNYFDIRYIGTVFAFFFLGSGFQTQLPQLAVITKDRKTNLFRILNRAIPLVFFLYVCQGLLVGLALPHVKPISSLEFKDYTGGEDPDDVQWWAYVVRFVITLFPALDLMSIFPLYAIALADNFLSVMVGYNQQEVPLKWWIASRVVTLVPIIVIGLSVRNIEIMFTAEGVCCIILMPLSIPMMSYYARQSVPTESPYDAKYNNKYVEIGIVILSLVLLPVITVLTILYAE